MSEQDDRQTATKRRRNRQTNKQDGTQAPTPQSPINGDKEAWNAYWTVQGQPWRTEPEIDEERQKYLAQRRIITPDFKQGIYPFKDIKLNRADVEWLLATHESGGIRGPVDWNDENQRKREGIDLRGADLYEVDMSGLPLAKTRAGITQLERRVTTRPQHFMAAVHLEHANLLQTHLEGAMLRNAHLEWANLEAAHLEHADCVAAHFENAYLWRASLDGTYLRRAFFSMGTFMNEVSLGSENIGFASLVDIRWSGVNLTTIQWERVKMLGDEESARRRKDNSGQVKDQTFQLLEYEIAVRANRQLALELQSQGLNEEAARFAYRAQKLQRVVLRRQKKFGQYFFSGFLDLLAGYGYRPGRSVIWYLVMIFGFALAYASFGHLPFLPDSLVFSLTSFHGRGFFPSLGSETSLHNPLVVLAAIEAVIGLFIEISFIATFTQRFFGR